jgi:hypothetical protein
MDHARGFRRLVIVGAFEYNNNSAANSYYDSPSSSSLNGGGKGGDGDGRGADGNGSSGGAPVVGAKCLVVGTAPAKMAIMPCISQETEPAAGFARRRAHEK